MRTILLACVLLVGCGGWPAVEPAPRNDLTVEQGEAYRALAHSLSNYMNARASNISVNLELAAILEEVLLHARAFADADWRQARNRFEWEFASARVPEKTIIDVMLETDARYLRRWSTGDQFSGEPILDNLIRNNGIQVVGPIGFSGLDFQLVVPREVNGYALENQVARASGILFPIPGWDLYAWGNGLQLGDSVVVRPEVCNGGWKLGIWVGWGDCPAGCIHGRAYTFQIGTSGETHLVEVSGEPLGTM